jgi:hypothetical protein
VTGFVLRAPWYVRERLKASVLDSSALRPAIQMYDGTDFVKRLLRDPRDSLAVTKDDYWSYPVPVSPTFQAAQAGRLRLATHQLVYTGLRKLYQPSHNRFYVLVAEVLCDQPGFPRAGQHDDFDVAFVMRRYRTSVTGERGPTRRLARQLMLDLAHADHIDVDDDDAYHQPPHTPEDVRDLWWADHVWHEQFEQDHHDLINRVKADTEHQGWFVFEDGSAGWRNLDDPAVGPEAPGVREDAIRMVRLPRGQKDCDAAATRSTWFGVIPTFSAEHYTVHCRSLPKLDDRAIYEATCLVTLKPKPGHEDCPPTVFYGTPSEAFRLASPMDPQGTSKRTTSITLPDLRRLAARAGQPMGPGGVQITTPPNSQLIFNPFKGRPDSGAGAVGAGGGVCTFALELFFLVAFFLFLMFLPIVVFAFQLWWMLALRFCIPPGASLSIVTQFFADGHVLAEVEANAAVSAAFDQQFGTESSQLADQADGWSTQLENAKDRSGNPIFKNDKPFVDALLVSTDASLAVPDLPPPLESTPDDPLCHGTLVPSAARGRLADIPGDPPFEDV